MSRNSPTQADWDPWWRKPAWSQRELSELCAGLIPGTPNRTAAEQALIEDANETIVRAVTVGALKAVERANATRADHIYANARLFAPAVAAAWAALQFPNTFPAELRAATHAEPRQASHSWPWGDYETKLLRKLAEAVDRYWTTNYDPADPTTANTNETVAAWLEEQGVAKRVAEVMAQIIRADGVRTGPRS